MKDFNLFSYVLISILFLGALLGPSQSAWAGDKLTIEHLENEIEKLRARGKEEKQADLLYRLGEQYFARGEFKKAAGTIEKALKIEDKYFASGSFSDKDKKKSTGSFIPRVHTRVALANVYIKQKRLPEAVNLYKEGISILDEMNLPEESAKLACHLGNIQIKTGNLAGAKTHLTRALELSRGKDLTEIEVSSLIGLATIERARKNNKGAMTLLKSARKAGDLTMDGIAYGRLLNEIGRTYADMDLYGSAAEQYKAAAKEFESAGELVLKAKVLTSLGMVYLHERDSEKALAVLKTAVETLSAEGESTFLVRALIPYGAALADSGSIEDALKIHKKAAKLARRGSDHDVYIQALIEEGYDHFLYGDMEKALKQYLKAEKFVKGFKGKVSPELKASILKDCGMGYRALGQLPEALKYYKQSAEYFSQAGKVIDQAIVLDSIAVAYLDQGETEKFTEYHNRALEVFSSREEEKVVPGRETRAQASLAYNQGQYYLYRGKYNDAVSQFEKSLDCYRNSADQLGHCHALRGLGLTYLMLGQVGKSKDSYEEAQVIASRIGNIESQWDCATGLGKAYVKLGDSKKAETALRQAVSLADRERRQFSRDSFKTAQLSLREDCFLELVELLFKDGRHEEALTVAESGRARAFLDMLEGRRQMYYLQDNAASDSEYDKKEASRRNPAQSSASAISRPDHPAIAASGDTAPSRFRSVKVRPKSGALVNTSSISSTSSAISAVNAKAPDAQELKSLVRSNASFVLEYITTPRQIMIWLLNPKGEIAAAKVVDCDLDRLKKLIRSTYQSIVTTPSGMDELHRLAESREKALKELYALLIKPVESSLPSDPDTVVTVVPYGALYLVPYAALLNSDNSFLIEKHSLAYLPSIAVLRATSKLRDQLSGKEDRLLAFGNPITERNKFIGKLPYAEKEVSKVASLFAPGSTNIEVGAAATKTKFRQLAPDYTYLHLATHGLINPDRPMDSSVVLAPEGDDDGLLTVKDILELPPLQSKLIVLSACQTGKGKVTGDGVIGLSRAFIIAGTPSVMVSQWNVDDVMTEYQMSLLYKELLSGKSKAKSLRTAQLKTIKFMEKGLSSSSSDDDSEENGSKSDALKGHERANPRYWAAFQVIGEYK